MSLTIFGALPPLNSAWLYDTLSHSLSHTIQFSFCIYLAPVSTLPFTSLSHLPTLGWWSSWWEAAYLWRHLQPQVHVPCFVWRAEALPATTRVTSAIAHWDRCLWLLLPQGHQLPHSKFPHTKVCQVHSVLFCWVVVAWFWCLVAPNRFWVAPYLC